MSFVESFDEDKFRKMHETIKIYISNLINRRGHEIFGNFVQIMNYI